MHWFFRVNDNLKMGGYNSLIISRQHFRVVVKQINREGTFSWVSLLSSSACLLIFSSCCSRASLSLFISSSFIWKREKWMCSFVRYKEHTVWQLTWMQLCKESRLCLWVWACSLRAADLNSSARWCTWIHTFKPNRFRDWHYVYE